MGKLFVVPTPVGNLEDMTFRAIRVLKEADLVHAEKSGKSVVYHLKLSVLEEALLGFVQSFGLDAEPSRPSEEPAK